MTQSSASDGLTLIGDIRTIFEKIRVVGIFTNTEFKKGSTVRVVNKDDTQVCEFVADSIEIDHTQVDTVAPESHCGVLLGCSRRDLPSTGDKVYLVSPPAE